MKSTADQFLQPQDSPWGEAARQPALEVGDISGFASVTTLEALVQYSPTWVSLFQGGYWRERTLHRPLQMVGQPWNIAPELLVLFFKRPSKKNPKFKLSGLQGTRSYLSDSKDKTEHAYSLLIMHILTSLWSPRASRMVRSRWLTHLTAWNGKRAGWLNPVTFSFFRGTVGSGKNTHIAGTHEFRTFIFPSN